MKTADPYNGNNIITLLKELISYLRDRQTDIGPICWLASPVPVMARVGLGLPPPRVCMSRQAGPTEPGLRPRCPQKHTGALTGC